MSAFNCDKGSLVVGINGQSKRFSQSNSILEASQITCFYPFYIGSIRFYSG